MKRLRRWLRLRRPTMGGLVRACLVFTIIACVMASQAVAYYDTPGLNGIASKLSGRKVTIHCLSKEEAQSDVTISVFGASAYVLGWNDPSGRWRPENYATFDYGICEALTAWMAGDTRKFTVDDLVWAAMVITHESGHMRGAVWSANEAKTQCWALQHLRSTLYQLGVREPTVVSFAIEWALWTQKWMPPAYQPASCRYPVP